MWASPNFVLLNLCDIFIILCIFISIFLSLFFFFYVCHSPSAPNTLLPNRPIIITLFTNHNSHLTVSITQQLQKQITVSDSQTL